MDIEARLKDFKAEAVILESLKKKIVTHIGPAVELGSGRVGRAHKWQALIHQLMLLSPQGGQDADKLARTLFATVSDFGVEASVTQVGPMRLREVVPWFQFNEADEAADREPPAPHQCPEDDFADIPALVEDPPPPPPPRDPVIDLSRNTDVPGMLHIVHNAGRGLETQLRNYQDATKRLQVVANLLRRPESSSRLETTCFDSDIGTHLWSSSGLGKFGGSCYPERWGTVACCLTQLTSDMQQALEWGWDLQKYRFGQAGAVQENDSEFSSQLGLVDETLSSPYWLAYWGMLKRIAKVLKAALEWCEGCRCHDELVRAIRSGDHDDGKRGQQDSPLRWILKAALGCCCRGRRCPELAAGDFDVFTTMLFDEEASVLVLELGRKNLDDSERTSIMMDFERARQHLMGTFTLKLHHWKEAHFQAFGIAHCDKTKALRCYFNAIRSASRHPLLQELRSDAFAEDRAVYEEARGGQLSLLGAEAPLLKCLMAKLRASPSAERPAEGLHAIVSRDIKRCPNHTTALVSLSNRFRQLTPQVSSAADLAGFARLLQAVPSGREAVKALGLQHHPYSVEKRKHKRDPGHFDVVYHADPYSKYVISAPDLYVPPRHSKPAPGICFVCMREMCVAFLYFRTRRSTTV